MDQDETGPSALKIVLISLSLILLGVLVGVLAAKFFQPAPKTPTNYIEDVITPEITENIIDPNSIEESSSSSSVIPQATPEALLKQSWKNYATSNYKLNYPTSWIFKYTPEKVTLTKLKNIITINKKTDIASSFCDLPTAFSINKAPVVWEIKESSPSSMYQVCETKEGVLVTDSIIGSISLKLAKPDQNIVDEFKYILEKIQIITPNSTK